MTLTAWTSSTRPNPKAAGSHADAQPAGTVTASPSPVWKSCPVKTALIDSPMATGAARLKKLTTNPAPTCSTNITAARRRPWRVGGFAGASGAGSSSSSRTAVDSRTCTAGRNAVPARTARVSRPPTMVARSGVVTNGSSAGTATAENNRYGTLMAPPRTR